MTIIIIIITSNVPARGAGTLLRPANQRRRWWPREKPLHSSLGVTRGQYASNAEGNDDGKNHRYAENHVFR